MAGMTEGAGTPNWLQNGHELFYRGSGGRVWIVDYSAKGDSFAASPPRLWSEKALPIALDAFLSGCPMENASLFWCPPPKKIPSHLRTSSSCSTSSTNAPSRPGGQVTEIADNRSLEMGWPDHSWIVRHPSINQKWRGTRSPLSYEQAAASCRPRSHQSPLVGEPSGRDIRVISPPRPDYLANNIDSTLTAFSCLSRQLR